MLETLPKTTVPECDNLLYMETISRKERLAQLAGIIMGEGCIAARVDDKAKNGKQVDLKLAVSNTDVGIIKFVSVVYVENGIGFYYATHNKTRYQRLGHKPALTIVVDGYRRLQKALSLILPYLCGSKKLQAELMLQLIARRQSQHKLSMEDTETNELIQRITAAKRELVNPLDCSRAANQVLQIPQSSTTIRSTESSSEDRVSPLQ